MREIKEIFKREKSKGFTLIELLLVIAIISILSGMVVASFGNAPAQSRDAKRVADLANIQIALEIYYDANDFYPKQAVPSEEVLLSAGTTGTALIDGDHIAIIPVDPVNDATYKYWYCGTTDGSAYAIKAKLETQSDRLDSDYDKDYPEGMAPPDVGCDCDDDSGYDATSTEGEQTAAPYIYCIRD